VILKFKILYSPFFKRNREKFARNNLVVLSLARFLRISIIRSSCNKQSHQASPPSICPLFAKLSRARSLEAWDSICDY
jgi:hypothetical protein